MAGRNRGSGGDNRLYLVLGGLLGLFLVLSLLESRRTHGPDRAEPVPAQQAAGEYRPDAPDAPSRAPGDPTLEEEEKQKKQKSDVAARAAALRAEAARRVKQLEAVASGMRPEALRAACVRDTAFASLHGVGPSMRPATWQPAARLAALCAGDLAGCGESREGGKRVLHCDEVGLAVAIRDGANGPLPRAVCEAAFAEMGSDFTATGFEAKCAAFTKAVAGGDAAAFCGPYGRRGVEKDFSCETFLTFTRGEAACAGFEDAEDRSLCVSFARLRAAAGSGAAACRGDEVCLAALRDPGFCSGGLAARQRAAVEAYCEVDIPRGSGGKRGDFQKQQAEIVEFLIDAATELDGIDPGGEAAAEIDKALKRAAALVPPAT